MRVKRFLAVAIMIIVISTYFSVSYLRATTLIDDTVYFTGIVPLEKDITTIIIVHGIGDHCIGYADSMISSVVSKLSEKKWENIQTGYSKYLKKSVKELSSVEDLEGTKFYFPRNGHCDIDKDDKDSIQYLKELYNNNKKLVNKSEIVEEKKDTFYNTDVETVVLGQDDLCASLHESAKDNYGKPVTVDCFRLSVDKNKELLHRPDENPEYITGFVRRITSTITANRSLRILEVTWNPSTRWIKSSLNVTERINGKASKHWVNRKIKSQIVNSAIADAIAYLSDSGILVNFNILQAFCLTLAGSQSDSLPYAFSCEKEFLQSTTSEFPEQNDVVLISHSLGTRAVFDTLGLLSKGISDGDAPKLMRVIDAKFKKIGAVVPEKYTNPTTSDEEGFSDLLTSRIPWFIQAISSSYVFTNQIPLLEANITSPFRPLDFNIGTEFSDFLKLRKNRLQIVAFHDPDDVLSYNLKCWFHHTVLKHMDTTKKLINNEAKRLAEMEPSDVSPKSKISTEGGVGRTLRDTLFNTCNMQELKTPEERTLFSNIWSDAEKELKLVDAAVRLGGWKLPFLVADPSGIHSNYFYDKTVHNWLINGKR